MDVTLGCNENSSQIRYYSFTIHPRPVDNSRLAAATAAVVCLLYRNCFPFCTNTRCGPSSPLGPQGDDSTTPRHLLVSRCAAQSSESCILRTGSSPAFSHETCAPSRKRDQKGVTYLGSNVHKIDGWSTFNRELRNRTARPLLRLDVSKTAEPLLFISDTYITYMYSTATSSLDFTGVGGNPGRFVAS